ncbi:MAG TPA: hypothetical protein VGM54_15590 [Chthoniobacter sp.]|jgi:hypothetical protein
MMTLLYSFAVPTVLAVAGVAHNYPTAYRKLILPLILVATAGVASAAAYVAYKTNGTFSLMMQLSARLQDHPTSPTNGAEWVIKELQSSLDFYPQAVAVYISLLLFITFMYYWPAIVGTRQTKARAAKASRNG